MIIYICVYIIHWYPARHCTSAGANTDNQQCAQDPTVCKCGHCCKQRWQAPLQCAGAHSCNTVHTAHCWNTVQHCAHCCKQHWQAKAISAGLEDMAAADRHRYIGHDIYSIIYVHIGSNNIYVHILGPIMAAVDQ